MSKGYEMLPVGIIRIKSAHSIHVLQQGTEELVLIRRFVWTGQKM